MSNTTAKSILLDSRVGWRAATTALSPDPNGALRIDALPGRAQRPVPAPAVVPDIGCPGSFATDPCQRVFYWLEDLSRRVHRATLPDLAHAGEIGGFGGPGAAPRRISQARGMAVLADGSIAVSDTGNGRIQVFSPDPWALLAIIGTAGEPRLARPWGLAADECGNLYVADRARRAVFKFYRDGQFRGQPISGLTAPTSLARSSNGALAVLDGTSMIVLRNGQTQKLDAPAQASAIALDDQDSIYVGTADGLLTRYVWDAQANGYRRAGDTLLGREGGIRQMVWTSAIGLLIALYTQCDPRSQLLRIPTAGASVMEGTLLTSTLDSGLEKCPWHRVELDADIPDGCSIEAATQTAATDIWSVNQAPFEPAPQILSLTNGTTDCLVQSAAGQFLRLRLRFRSNGVSSPLVRSIRLHFPRDSYIKYLPAIYQEDVESRFFLDRFLSIFQTTFDAYDQLIDNISDLFDPLATPEKMLPWLSAWLALPLKSQWTAAERRAALKQAWSVYQRRGTPNGLEQLILTYTKVNASVMEHFRIRPLLILGTGGQRRLGQTTRLWSRDFYARLQLDAYSTLGYFRIPDSPEPAVEALAWGANKFSLFFLAEPDAVDDTLKQVTEIVEREKPAHTEATYCPVFARMRVGVQASIGVDTRLGVIDPMVLTRTTLGYDSILGCSHRQRTMRRAGASLEPRTGISATLQ